MARAPRPGSLHLPAIIGPFITLGLVYGVWYSYSVLLVALVKEFAWPRALAAGAFSLFVLVHGGAGPLVGRLVETLGARVVITSGALALAAGLLLAAETRTWWHLYLAFGMIAAAGSCAAGWVPAVTIVRRWHPDGFGTAVGIASAGTGVGIVLARHPAPHRGSRLALGPPRAGGRHPDLGAELGAVVRDGSPA